MKPKSTKNKKRFWYVISILVTGPVWCASSWRAKLLSGFTIVFFCPRFYYIIIIYCINCPGIYWQDSFYNSVEKSSLSRQLPRGLYANLSRGASSFAPDSVTSPSNGCILSSVCICHFPLTASHPGHGHCFLRLTSCSTILSIFLPWFCNDNVVDRCSNISFFFKLYLFGFPDK